MIGKRELLVNKGILFGYKQEARAACKIALDNWTSTCKCYSQIELLLDS